MRLRRFCADTAPLALQRVKETLGENALILATRERPEGGVEITAATDEELLGMAGERGTRRAASDAREADDAALDPARERWRLSGGSSLAALFVELRELNARLRRIERAVGASDAWSEDLDPEARHLADRLEERGLAPQLAGEVATSFAAARRDGHAYEEALAAGLSRHVPLMSAESERERCVFIGPTGSGKTTTIAKLAARRVLARAGRTALVVADTHRLGAHEQLAAYGRLLELPVAVARDQDELDATLRALGDFECILVDTGGMAADGTSDADVQRLLEALGAGARVTAVVSASTSRRSLARAWAQMHRLAPDQCVVTHLDESEDPGALCTWLVDVGVPLRWLGTGRRVPGDLHAASGASLARWLLGETRGEKA